MNMKQSGLILLIIALLSGFSTLAFAAQRNQLSPFDHTVTVYIQSFESPHWTSVMKFFTFIGAGSSIHVLVVLISIILYFFLKHRSEIILLMVVLIGSHHLFRMLKLYFQRVRPDLHRLIEIGGYSFPSGHATNAISLYGILTFIIWRHIHSKRGKSILLLTSTVMILMIGISRIYLGVHYPSDILAGYLSGGLWVILAIQLYLYILQKIHSITRQHF